jgi:nitrite reductase/ring-hydroxylating ferredoxin subunit
MSNGAVTARPGAGLDDILARTEKGLTEDLLPVEIFNDAAVFQAEVARIFARSWVFVAHESEIPDAGDFVQRRIGIDPVIVTRDGEGGINVLSNFCRHRGTQVCQTDQGNSRFFKCAYHGWTYANTGELIGTPFLNRAYGEPVDGKRWGLLRAPRVESRHEFVFASLSDDVPSLDEYLGGAGWMLDAMMGLHPDGMRVAGPPDRYHVRANWKTAADNFAGDVYHVPNLHASMVEIGVARGIELGLEFGRPYQFENGHSFMGIAWTTFAPGFEFWGYPAEVTDRFDLSGLDETQRHVVTHDGPIVGTVFPNLSFYRGAATAADGETSVITTFRQWQPAGPGELEVWSWQLVWKFEDDASALKHAVLGQQQFGVAGLAEQDDTVVWEGAARAGASPWARKTGMAFHFQQGNNSEVDQSPDPTWRGPGIRRLTGYGEHNQLHFYRHWLRVMQNHREQAGESA